MDLRWFLYLIGIVCGVCDGAIRCYKCTAANEYTKIQRLCSNFEFSEKFIVDCPYSTFCMKKSFSADIAVKVNGTERDCAHQSTDGSVYKDGRWHKVTQIEEPYSEGCSTVNDYGLRKPKMEFCYCKTDLCNNHKKLFNHINYSVIFLFVSIIKYLIFYSNILLPTYQKNFPKI